MSAAPTTPSTKAEIVGFKKDPWGNAVVEIRAEGKNHSIDRRCVNTGNPQVGQRGWLEYRDYEFGFRLFFDPAVEILNEVTER